MMLLAIEQTKAMLEEVKRGLEIPPYMGGNEFLGRVKKVVSLPQVKEFRAFMSETSKEDF